MNFFFGWYGGSFYCGKRAKISDRIFIYSDFSSMRPDWIEVQWYVQNGTVSTSFDWSGKKRREAITVISYQLFITCVFHTIWKLNKAQPSKGGLVRGYDKPIHGSCASRTDAAGSIRQLMQQCHVVLKDHGCVMLLDKVGFTPLIPGISN